jgi:hypothetical protein
MSNALAKKMFTGLVPINEAKQLLCEVSSVDQSVDIGKKIKACREYDSKTKERRTYWAELSLWNDRTTGKLIQDAKKKKLIGHAHKPDHKNSSGATLSLLLGIDSDDKAKHISKVTQKLAKPSEDEFQAAIELIKESGEEVSRAAVAKVLAGDKIKKKKEEIEAELRAKLYDETLPRIEKSDCVEWLQRQEPCDLLLTDPPYSTDVDDIEEFAKSWLPLALSKVKPTGRAYVCIGAYPKEISAYCSVAMPNQILVWTYRNTLGPSPKQQYKLNWQAILYYEESEAPPLDCPIMTEQFSVQDINAPDGRLGDRYHAWQKPMELAERFIRHSTKEGDTVIDPFACTGTFLLAAAKLGRLAKGCDISQENIDIAIERGCANEK